MSGTRTHLSVDLGSLRVAAAVDRGDGPVAVTLGAAGPTCSAAMALDGDRWVIGDAAERILATRPDHGVRELKRRFGDTTPLVLAGRTATADVLVGELLAAVAAAAGVSPADCSLHLTHPASWHEYKTQLLTDVAARAGFADVSLSPDPVAAAQAYRRSGRLHDGDTVAVFCLGGMFEATVVALGAAGPQVVGVPQTLERLGGDVFDQLVFRHVDQALGGNLQQLDRNDPAVRSAIQQLRASCTTAKEQLSEASETAVAVSAPGLDTRVRITRDEFETAARPLVEETLQALERALEGAGVQIADLSAVVLAGGGSRIPVVAEMVAGRTGRPALGDLDSGLVVALGALAEMVAAPAAGVTSLAAAPAAESAADASTGPSAGASTGAGLLAAATVLAAAAPVAAAQPIAGADAPTTASERETAMSDQQKPADPTGERRIPAPPPAPAKKAPSKAAKVAGAAAAAAAAVAAGVVYGDDVVNAISGDDDGGAPTPPPITDTRTADRAEREADDDGNPADDATLKADAPDDSMDAFDTVAPDAAGAAAPGVPLGAPAAQGFAPPVQHAAPRHQQQQQQFDDGGDDAPQRQQQFVADDAPSAAAPPPPPPAAPAVDPGFESQRQELLDRLDDWQPPDGTSPEDAAQLKADLRDAIERFQPDAGQSADDAMADLRDDFDRRVHDFTQDQKIDALIDETQRDNAADADDDAAAADGSVTPPPDDLTEADRADGTDDPGTASPTGAGTTGDGTDEPGPGIRLDPDVIETIVESTGGLPGVGSDEPGAGIRLDPDVISTIVEDTGGLPGARGDDGGDEGQGSGIGRAHFDDGLDVRATIDPAVVAAASSDPEEGGEFTGIRGAIDPDMVIASADPEEGGEFTGIRGDAGIDLGDLTIASSDPQEGGEATGPQIDSDLMNVRVPIGSVADVDLGDAPVVEDPDAGGEIGGMAGVPDFPTSPAVSLVDDFDALTIDPGESPEATGIGDAIDDGGLQVRATLPDGFVPPTMTAPAPTDDVLGDGAFQAAVLDIPAPLADATVLEVPGVPEPPAPLDGLEPPLEPASIVGPDDGPDLSDVAAPGLDIAPVFADDDLDDDGPGFGDDIGGDVTPNAPTNLDFGG